MKNPLLALLLLALALLSCTTNSQQNPKTASCLTLLRQCELRVKLCFPLAAQHAYTTLEQEYPIDETFLAQKQHLQTQIQKLQDSLQTASAQKLLEMGPSKPLAIRQEKPCIPYCWPKDEGDCVLVYRDGKYGFARRDGSMVTAFEFDRADPFFYGFARVDVQGKQFLVDADGKRYATAFSVSEIQPETEVIDLTISELKEVPEDIFHATKLKVLRLGVNRIEELPAKIIELSELEVLDLNTNALMQFPIELVALKKLKCLRLSSNSLIDFSFPVGEFLGLRELYIDDNFLSKLPVGIFQLTELQKLSMAWNHFEDDDFLGIHNLNHLRVLNCSGDHIASVSDQFGALTALTDLDLGVNDFTTLPNSVGKLKQLKALDIGSENLNALPSFIQDLTELRVLSLQSGKIADTPEKQAAIVKQIAEWLPNCKVYFD